MGGKSQPAPAAPPPPDYAGAAQQTAAGDLQAAQYAQTANMVNQVTPYGRVTYTPTQVGTSSAATGSVPINQWTQTVTLSPEQQAMFEQNMGINRELGDIATSGVGYVKEAMANPLSVKTPIATSAGDPQLLLEDTKNALYKNQTQFLDPQFERGQLQLENKLANQGITPGSEAYKNAMMDFANQKQQAYESARNASIAGAQQAAQGMFGMGLSNANLQNTAGNLELARAQTLQQNPINMLNAVRTGQQMQVANVPQTAVSAPGQQATTSGPDMLGAANALGNYNMNAYQQQMQANAAGQSSGNSALGGIASIAGMAMGMM